MTSLRPSEPLPAENPRRLISRRTLLLGGLGVAALSGPAVAGYAGIEATALLESERGLADHPGLAMEVAALATDERAEYLEKA